jgi:hypothetical protein
VEPKKILVVDESGFAHVCRSLLELLGYRGDSLVDQPHPPADLDLQSYDLLITSYPFGSSYLPQAQRCNRPTILLSNFISAKLIQDISDFSNLHCLIKPLDFPRFSALVRELVEGTIGPKGGYTIG